MDGFSAAASGIAVASIAIQLLDSVNKLRDFWNSFKDAPEDIRAISLELALLSSVLTHIAHEAQHAEPDATLEEALNGCSANVNILIKLLNEIEPGFSARKLHTRKWTALKAVLKRGQITKFQEALDRLQITLVLAQQNQMSYLSRNRHSSRERGITHIVSRLSIQQPPNVRTAISNDLFNRDASHAEELCFVQSHTSASNVYRRKEIMVKQTLRKERSLMECFLGTIRTESSTKIKKSREETDLFIFRDQDQYEYESEYIIYPARWLVYLGLRRGFHVSLCSSSTQGWKNTFRPFTRVPDDALIFQFCEEGNTSGVRALLERGDASVRDTDSRGYTPLHFAAKNHRSELCKFLVNAAADIATSTFKYSETPMRLAVEESRNTTSDTLTQIFDTFRLLAGSMDFSDELISDGWIIFEKLGYYIGREMGEEAAKACLLGSMIKLSNFELKTYGTQGAFARILDQIILYGGHLVADEPVDLLMDLGGTGVIDAPILDSDGYNILLSSVESNLDAEVISRVLAKGADPHRQSYEKHSALVEESPTSLAMYSSARFRNWVCALASAKVDLEQFVSEELRTNHKLHPNWAEKTLLDLFAYGRWSEFVLDFCSEHNVRLKRDGCDDCDGFILVSVQPYWRHFLERFKRAIAHGSSTEKSLEGDETAKNESESIRDGVDAASESDRPLDSPSVTSEELPASQNYTESLGYSVDPRDLVDPHGYPSTVSVHSECLYAKDELICMECWGHYVLTGTRGPSQRWKRRRSVADCEDEEYSPYHIHT